MRLNHKEQKIIISTIKDMFADAELYLFGSRADDNQRGGDIDLFLTASKHISLSEKINLLTRFERRGIERKVDLIIQDPDQRKPTLFNEVLQKGIRLC